MNNDNLHFIAQSLMEGHSGSVVQRLIDGACEVQILDQQLATDDILSVLPTLLPPDWSVISEPTIVQYKDQYTCYEIKVVRS